MQGNRQHTHKIVTQDIPWETLIEGKTQPPKASIIMYYSTKIPLQYNHGSLQMHSHNQEIHVNKHESTHVMPCFQPSQMLSSHPQSWNKVNEVLHHGTHK